MCGLQLETGTEELVVLGTRNGTEHVLVYALGNLGSLFLIAIRLVVIPKPNGKPRPICIGESLRRFALGTLHAKLKPRLQKRLEPHQLGLSLDGTTLAVNELAAYLENNQQAIMLVLHFKNAFN